MIISKYSLEGPPDAGWISSVEESCIWGDLCIHATQPTDVKLLEPLFRSRQCSVQLHDAATEDDCLDYLDAGAMYVVLTPEQIKKMENVPKNRIACLLAGTKGCGTALAEGIPSLVFLHFPDSVPLTRAVVAQGCQDHKIPDNFQVIVSGKPPSCQEAGKMVVAGYTVQMDGALTASDAELSVAGILTGMLKSDREDGLFPTVVVDESHISLGLVYSSAKSLAEAIRLRRGVYQSRKRGLWFKGESSGDTQDLLRVDIDCDFDSLRFIVRQHGVGFCHLQRYSCFGPRTGIEGMVKILQSRKQNAPAGSYTKRLFDDKKLLQSKLLEEAQELADAVTPKDVAWETADVLYFAMVKCVQTGVSLSDVSQMLLQRTRRVRRRRGDAKPDMAGNGAAHTHLSVSPATSLGFPSVSVGNGATSKQAKPKPKGNATCSITVVSPDGGNGAASKLARPAADAKPVEDVFTGLQVHASSSVSATQREELCRRPAVTDNNRLMKIVQPILADVRSRGDKAVLELTAKFDNVLLDSPVIPVPPLEEIQVTDEVRDALEVAYSNVYKFHDAQLTEPLTVETCPGVVCRRFSRAIEKVGLYVPGGSAVLPSTALMLSVPARVAGCEHVLLATPPRKDGTVSPEVLYVAAKSGIKTILLAGGAQAIAAMAYGTESVPKVDKICGPGNAFVTMAKMLVQNDSTAMVGIDMPAGPSEVMVVADSTANPVFVAADLLSQAEHGPDSQVVLIAVGLSSDELEAVQAEVKSQLSKLPRNEIASVALSKSFALRVETVDEGLAFANQYAPEHLILNVRDAATCVEKVVNAGSVFVGPYSAESCGDYASGTNHTLPTYSYAKMYSGVNTGTFQKQITSQELTAEGLVNIGPAVATLAAVEGLEAHRQAVVLRMEHIKQQQQQQ